MPSVWLISDTHFGHVGACQFFHTDGITKLRPWTDPNEMDEFMVKAWNEKVGPKDKIYHLGDVCINRRSLKILSRLNGDKVLIKGNHDIFKLNEYTEYFRDVRGYHVMNGLILSHIPIFPDGLYRFGANIHGHLHEKRVKINGEIDPRYFNVSVEQIGFSPILFEDVLKKIKEQGGTVGFKQSGRGPD